MISKLFAGCLLLLPFLACPALGQDSAGDTPDFVPGELIVGFKSPEARDGAVQDLQDRASQGGITRGSATSRSVQVEPLDDLSVRIRLRFVTRGGDSPTKDAELQILEETATSLREDDRVSYAHPNWILQLNRPRIDKMIPLGTESAPASRSAMPPGGPNDPVFTRGLHWHYMAAPAGMNAVGAWEHGTESKDVVVAVLDTGILPAHPDIKESGNILPGYDFVRARTPVDPADGDDWDADPTDPGDTCRGRQPSWHGTHVAGTIGAGATNNALGIAGIAWEAAILPVRVLGRCGGTIADIAAALRWTAGLPVAGAPPNPTPADILNLSLGMPLRCRPVQVGILMDALAAVEKAGSVVVVAAGNDNVDVATFSPAGCAGVISVGASDGRGELAPYSNFGALTVLAPGGDLERDDDKDGYPDGIWSLVDPTNDNPQGVGALEGTSMAAPHVTAALALWIAKHPKLRRQPGKIKQALTAAVGRNAPLPCPPARKCDGTTRLDAGALIGP
jgi:subtilisin family serine protease